MRNSLFTLLLVMFGAVAVTAQTFIPHYVDINDAESEIAGLEILNREIAGQTAELEEKNRLLEENVAQKREFILQADEMINQLKAPAGDIYTLLQSVNDAATRRDLLQRMEENRQSRYEIENRKRRENQEISRFERDIANNRKTIVVNRMRTRDNNERVEYLRASIVLSIAENKNVSEVLANADRVRLEADQLLDQ